MNLFSFAPPVRPLLTNSLGGLKASCLFFDFSNVDHSVISAAAVVSLFVFFLFFSVVHSVFRLLLIHSMVPNFLFSILADQ